MQLYVKSNDHRSVAFRSCSPPAATTNVLTQPVPADLLPLDLLPCDWQLSPQALEGALAQTAKRLVEVLLVLLLDRGHLPRNLARARARADVHTNVLVGKQPDVAILVVVDVDFDGAGQAAGGGVVHVGRAPAAVPVVRGRVLVRDGHQGELGVVLHGKDAVR